MIHDLKIRSDWSERVVSGEKRAEVRVHDRDFQAGDTLHLIEVDNHGHHLHEYVERDARGRFVRDWVPVPPVVTRITHVLPARLADGVLEGYCVLSIEVVEAEGAAR